MNHLEDSAALIGTHEDRDELNLIWCNKKFEQSLELGYFSANQAFNFKIFKYEAIVRQVKTPQMTLYQFTKPEINHPLCNVKSLLDIVREFKQKKSTTSS